jgi:hypothetical protein
LTKAACFAASIAAGAGGGFTGTAAGVAAGGGLTFIGAAGRTGAGAGPVAIAGFAGTNACGFAGVDSIILAFDCDASGCDTSG